MKKTKRILSVLLAMFMLLSVMVPMVSAADYSDVPNTHKYYKEITNLSVYGILNGFEDGTFRPEDGVTRAQFAKIICYALNVGDNITSGAVDTGFTDVDPNHWAAGNIKMATSMGIINGMGDGTFQPESPVLFEQAVKMVVCALGYAKQAEANGGYYQGHMTVAANIGLLKGSDGKVENAANRGTIANLVDNMLGADQVTTSGEKGGSLKDERIKTISEDGQIVSVYGTTIYPNYANPCSRNQIELLVSGGKSFTYSVSELDSISANILDYLGKRVTVYYSADDELRSPILTNLTLQANKNIEKTIDLADITDYSDTNVEYMSDYNTGEVEEISVLGNANILYNGVATTDNLSNLLDPTKPGQVTFLDSDSDSDADVVFIKEYTTMIVKSKATSTWKLYDEDAKTGYPKNDIVLNEEDKTMSISIKKNGSASSFKNINTGDVVSYASSADGKVIDVLVSNKSVSNATVSSYNATQKKVTLRASGKDTEYKLSTDFDKYTDAILEVGMVGKFYIDAFNKVIKADVSSETKFTYAYLTGFENVGAATAPAYAIQVINIDGTTAANEKVYNLAEKFRIDGVQYSGSDDPSTISKVFEDSAITFNNSSAYAGDAATKYCQVIKYTTNTAGAIDRIFTADYSADEANKLKINNDYVTSGANCTTAGSKLESKYTVSSAKILFVPETRKEAGSDKFVGYRASSFFKAKKSYKVQLIDTTDSYSVPVIIVYGTSEEAKDTTWATIAPVVVKDKNEETFEVTGEPTTCLTVLNHSGEEVKYYKGEDTVGDLSAVAIGDIIRIDADSDGVIQEFKTVTTLEKMLAADAATAGEWGEGDNSDQDYAQYRHIIGTAVNVEGSNILVSQAFVANDLTLDKTTEKSVGIGSAKVILVDSTKLTQNKAVSFTEMGEIIGFDNQPENASKVLVYTTRDSAKLVVIFR